MSLERRKEYIQTTYQIIKEEGIEGIKIRKLAQKIGCTSSSLYKYFEDVDHLVNLASIKFLDHYMRYFIEVREDTKKSLLERHLCIWDCFVRDAFHAQPIFENLFFGKYNDQLSDTIYEYYRLFPEELRGLDGFSVSILFSGNLMERDYVWLRRMANQGFLTMEAAKYLSRVNILLFHGMLMELGEQYKDPEKASQAADDFSKIFRELYSHYIDDPLLKE